MMLDYTAWQQQLKTEAERLTDQEIIDELLYMQRLRISCPRVDHLLHEAAVRRQKAREENKR